MCGSGTFLIEAALHALKIAPGLRAPLRQKNGAVFPNRPGSRNASVRWTPSVGRHLRAKGFVIEPASVELAQENAKKAGLRRAFRVEQRALCDFKLETDKR
jgi:putative N6-adenine-specific DNA methylase